jgi:hypothetical protein
MASDLEDEPRRVVVRSSRRLATVATVTLLAVAVAAVLAVIFVFTHIGEALN